MTVNTKYFKKFPLNYGPESRRWFCSIIPTSSAGTIPSAEIRESHNISSVRRLADGSYEFNFSESPLSGAFVNPRLVGVSAPFATGSYVISSHQTGSRVMVWASGSQAQAQADHSWTRLDVEFWGRFSR